MLTKGDLTRHFEVAVQSIIVLRDSEREGREIDSKIGVIYEAYSGTRIPPLSAAEDNISSL